MAIKRDEAHPLEVNKKLTLIISVIFLIAVLLLVYLITYSFVNLDPLITIVLIIVLLIVVVVGIFSLDVSTFREVH